MKQKKVQTILILSFFTLIFLYVIDGIHDPDLPWHLATGKYIIQNRQIPTSDPFSFAGDNEEIPFLGKFILSQYWLAQIIFSLIYELGGIFGLVFFRSFLLTLTIFIIFSIIRKKGIQISLFISGFYISYTFKCFGDIRPVIFTLFFTSVLMFLLEKYRLSSNYKYLYIIPFLMICWSNMHGGYIFGLLLLYIYLTSYIFNKFFYEIFKDDINKYHQNKFILIVIISTIVSLLNPNGWLSLQYVFSTHSGDIFSAIGEYASPLNKHILFTRVSISFWCMLPLSLFLFITSVTKRRLIPFFLTLIPVVMSLESIRYIPFMVLSTSVALNHLPMTSSRLKRNDFNLLYLYIILILVVILFRLYHLSNRTFNFTNNRIYSVNAVQFLKKMDLSGNIFSSYNRSAFLIFNLFPSSKLFFDSRFISPQRVDRGLTMEGLHELNENKKALIRRFIYNNSGLLSKEQLDIKMNSYEKSNDWFNTLEQSGAEIIIHEAINSFSGQLYPLILRLYFEDNWKLIYLDNFVLIFLKNIDKFKQVISVLEKPKNLIVDEIIQEANIGIQNGRLGVPTADNYAYFYAHLAFGLIAKGKTDDRTRGLLQEALKISPNNIDANIYNDFLNEIRLNCFE
jgi:hypothetical protein